MTDQVDTTNYEQNDGVHRLPSTVDAILAETVNDVAPTNIACTTSIKPNIISLLDGIPIAVMVEFLLPFLDRPSWNALQVASKAIRKLVVGDKTTMNNSGVNTISPPWPDRCFVATSATTTNSIESFTISANGEYLAYGSVLGAIEVWNRRLGKVVFQKSKNGDGNSRRNNDIQSPSNDLDEEEKATTGSQVRRRSPLGSCLKFAPVGTVLACGFENRIFLWEISSYGATTAGVGVTVANKVAKQHHHYPLSNGTTADHNNNIIIQPKTTPVGPFKVIELDCCRGTMYEVTYIAFSNDAKQLIARYGKMAYIWTLTYPKNDAGGGETSSSSSSDSLPNFSMTHQIPLNSSRCHMATSPYLHQLAVTNASSSDDKGMIDVWDLTTITTTKTPTTGQQSSTASMPQSKHHPQQQESYTNNTISDQSTMTCPTTAAITPTSVTAIGGTSLTCRIVAYDRRKVIRGLEFVTPTSTSSSLSSSCNTSRNDPWLVSASLQGEIKFWMGHPPHQNGSNRWYYSCIFSFQSPGKIFSMALSSPSSRGCYTTTASTYLAVGQAKGQIRVWRVPTLDDRNIVIEGDNDHEQNNDSPPKTYHNKNDATVASLVGNTNASTTMDEYLAADVGDHTHHDNIKLIAFTPDGMSLVASRSYDARIWFQTFHH
jgi:hypothetical protein